MTKRSFAFSLLMLALVGTGSSVSAQDAGQAPTVDTGDTAWVLLSSALVLLMTIPGWPSSTAEW